MYFSYCKLNVNNNLRVRANISITSEEEPTKNLFCFYTNSFTRGHPKGYIIHNKTVPSVICIYNYLLRLCRSKQIIKFDKII